MPATPKDKVRLLISDVGGESGSSFLYSDLEIESFLEMKNGNVFRAAALALRSIANNSVQVSKRIKFLQLQTDGPAEAKALNDLAGELDTAADNSVTLDWATMNTDAFTSRYLMGLGDS